MPINIPQDLPAYQTLINELVFVMRADKALAQDIRPLKVAIVNLMPTKIETETQILRLLSNSPLQIDITLIRTETYMSKNTSFEHLTTFYKTFNDVKDDYFDALFITGAPVEQLPFEEVAYWNELCAIMEWSKSRAWCSIHICWGAQAGLYYHYGIQKYPLNKKMFGIYPQTVHDPNHPLVRGFNETFDVPQSRHTEVRIEDIEKNPSLKLLASSPLSGAHLIIGKTIRQIFITGHAEYDRDTLKTEYFRDKDKGLEIELPHNYFPDNDDTKTPVNTWRGHASLMYSNLLNFCVYQETPYDLTKLEKLLI
ncbi:MAG: homoserine O-succinyltransferase [Oscillospiraceae bacterium]|nr:homoserine O-succinyltransferase [Oscillospiraceae bacterium]